MGEKRNSHGKIDRHAPEGAWQYLDLTMYRSNGKRENWTKLGKVFLGTEYSSHLVLTTYNVIGWSCRAKKQFEANLYNDYGS